MTKSSFSIRLQLPKMWRSFGIIRVLHCLCIYFSGVGCFYSVLYPRVVNRWVWEQKWSCSWKGDWRTTGTGTVAVWVEGDEEPADGHPGDCAPLLPGLIPALGSFFHLAVSPRTRSSVKWSSKDNFLWHFNWCCWAYHRFSWLRRSCTDCIV